MTEAESVMPRRAMRAASPLSGASPDDSSLDNPLDPPSHRPSRAIWATLDGDELDEPPTTPVPPPSPVLPGPDSALRALGGRAAPADDVYVPRRSATSVSSPPEPPESLEPTVAEAAAFVPTLPPPPRIPERRTGLTGFWADKRQRLTALAVIGLAILALVAGLVITNLPAGTPTPGTSATPSTDSSAPDPAQLVAPEDLTALGDTGAWTIVDTVTAPTASSPQPLCAPATPDSQQAATNRQERRLSATSGATLLQLHEIYPTAEAATAAFNARLPQVNGCAGSTVLVGGTSTVAGLADAAAAVTVTLQEVKAEGHTVLLARTGRFLDIVDLGNPDKALSSAALAKAVAPSLQRQCGVAAGTCPTTVKAESILGVTTGELGWLIENDLPRVTLGAGRWGATTSGPPNLVGSQCEAVDLNQVPKATQSLHRTYLLADDSAAPSGFGVDEAVYTFATATEATALVRKIDANFESCRTRTRTATVTTLKPASTTGADGAKVTVQGFTVVQRVSATKNVAFRVALAAVGTRVVYLLANPSGDFDFTDAQWTAAGTRAAQRATQF